MFVRLISLNYLMKYFSNYLFISVHIVQKVTEMSIRRMYGVIVKKEFWKEKGCQHWNSHFEALSYNSIPRLYVTSAFLCMYECTCLQLNHSVSPLIFSSLLHVHSILRVFVLAKVHTHTHTHTHTHVYIYIYIYIYIFVCVCVCVCVWSP